MLSPKSKQVKLKEILWNQLLREVLKKLVKKLLYQFMDRKYDSNKVLRLGKESVQTAPSSHQKKQVLMLWPEIEKFIWNLTISPKYWVVMLQKEKFSAVKGKTINLHFYTNKIFRFVLDEGQKITSNFKVLSTLASEQIMAFLEEVSEQICEVYQEGSSIISHELKQLQNLVHHSKLVNFYFLYKLLLQVSQHSTKKIIKNLQMGLLKHVQTQYSSLFAQYILEKHQLLKIIFDSEGQKLQDKPLVNIMKRIQAEKDWKWREAIREDGQPGIIIEFVEEEGAPTQSYLITLNEEGKVKVTNTNVMVMEWKITSAAQKNYDIVDIVSDKNQLAEKLRNTPSELEDVELVDYVGSLGGTLGKCLANIEDYDSVGAFMFDVSRKELINGTFNYVVTQIPLLGILLASGGYTFSVYSIFNSKFKSKKVKMHELGLMTVDVAGTVGSSLLGAVIGQTFIPVPFLGVFIGGLLGSFVGEIGGKALARTLESMRFTQIIQELQQTMQPTGYWIINKKTVSIFGISLQYFFSFVPNRLKNRPNNEQIWFAIVAFTVLCFNQSRKRAEQISAKTQSLVQKKKEKEASRKIFNLLKNDMKYEPSVKLLVVIKYLETNKVDITCFYKQLQNIIDQIFSRIK